MTPLSRLSLHAALDRMGRRRARSAVAVLTVMAPLYVLGLFGAVYVSLAPALTALRQEAHLVVFLEDRASDEARRSVEQLLARPEVKDRRFIPPEEAALRLSRLVGVAATGPGAIPAESLPASYEVVLTAAGTRSPDDLLRALREAAGVAEVAEQLELGRRVSVILRLVTALGVFLGLILVAAAHVTVSNVIRLVFTTRREEVEILKVVGATDDYVRAPFLAEGTLMGAAGGVLATLGLLGTKLVAAAVARRGGGLLAELVPELRTPPLLVLFLWGLGAGIGYLASHAALRDLLRPPEV